MSCCVPRHYEIWNGHRSQAHAGVIYLLFDGIHPLIEARTALKHMAAGHAHGKVIVSTSR